MGIAFVTVAIGAFQSKIVQSWHLNPLAKTEGNGSLLISY